MSLKKQINVVMPNIFPVACHTDNIGKGSMFVAVQGDKQNGVAYISEAIERGATTIVVHNDVEFSEKIIKKIKDAGAHVNRVANCRQALASLSAQANGYPAKKLKIIGITGTKGKSSTAFMLEHMLRHAGHKTALISTVYNKIIDSIFNASLTTEHPDYIHSFFAQCVKADVEYVVMEVAAQALSLHRVDGIDFDGALFTNFDQEHAEFYPHLNDYFAAKCLLFDRLKASAPALINVDDEWGKKILTMYSEFLSFGLCKDTAKYCAQLVESVNRLSCEVAIDGEHYVASCPALFGKFNAYNMLGAFSLAYELGIDPDLCIKALTSFSGIPGRLERHELPNGAYAFIDKAHNPSSFSAVLSSLRAMTENLIVVFGAGGDRDKTKRPQMGSVAAQYADSIVLTSDNPRSEKTCDIIENICSGINKEDLTKTVCELDREVAISKAYQLSKKGSIIALLGKGPDEYELVGDTKFPFSEKQILKKLNTG